MRLIAGLIVVLVFGATPGEAANYCVKTGGSDATVKASISYVAGNEGGSTCWQTIGRALWGATTRSSPSAAQAADAGDTVFVFGGTYSNALNCSGTVGVCKFTVLYGPVNQGTAGNYLTITCVGDCLIAAPDWNGAIVGANARNYIKWYADVSQGHSWQMNAYAPLDDAAAADEVDITADTGPCVCTQATGCWFEGFILDGGDPGDPYPTINENYPAFRVEHGTNVTIRNNDIRNFTETGNHGAAINTYHSSHGTYEHNYISNVGLGHITKDNGSDDGVSSMTIRFNRITDVGYCFAWSMTAEGTEPTTLVHQNICTNFEIGVFSTGNTGSPRSADIFNNAFHSGSQAGVWVRNLYVSSRFWNNIIHTVPRMLFGDSGDSGPTAAQLDLEHNDYYNATTAFYTGGDGTRTKASFDGAFNGQHDDSPASIETDPLFANTAGDDYRLCTGSGVPHASCAGASPALAIGVDALDLDGDLSTSDTIPAGPYVTGNEVIGVSGDSAAAETVPRSRVRLKRDAAAAMVPLLVVAWLKRKGRSV